ncbi:MAG: vWA domain-containing protein [Smithella sp.]
MFVNFFYTLRDRGIPVTPTSFLRLQKAMNAGLVHSLDDFYTVARTILVKSERYFDTYDQIFAHHFENAFLEDPTAVELTAIARAMLEEWLQNPEGMADALGIDQEKLKKMTPEELIQYFLDRLKEQTEAHHGGNKWIGTKGTSPTGHSGTHPGGMRVGGESRNHSAIKVALERRYRDYSQDGPLTQSQMGEALKRLRRMAPTGPKDIVNVDSTVYETMRNAGEIEIIFDRRLADRLKVILLIDNGGWSMDPYIDVVQTLFHYASSQFKDLKIYFFHNTIYNRVWADPQRYYKPQEVDDFVRLDPETRLIIVGDANMAPYELIHPNGSIYIDAKQTGVSLERLKSLSRTFHHSVWLNPMSLQEWSYSRTTEIIRQVFPMFELTLDGLEKAVQHLASAK